MLSTDYSLIMLVFFLLLNALVILFSRSSGALQQALYSVTIDDEAVAGLRRHLSDGDFYFALPVPSVSAPLIAGLSASERADADAVPYWGPHAAFAAIRALEGRAPHQRGLPLVCECGSKSITICDDSDARLL